MNKEITQDQAQDGQQADFKAQSKIMSSNPQSLLYLKE